MALITCSECGKSYSDKANACPACGCPTNLQPYPETRSPKQTIINSTNINRANSSSNQNTLRIAGLLAILFGAILALSTGLITGSDKVRSGSTVFYSRNDGEKLTAYGFITVGIASILGGVFSLARASDLLSDEESDHTQTEEGWHHTQEKAIGVLIQNKTAKKSQRTKREISKYNLYYELMHIAYSNLLTPGNMSLPESIKTDNKFIFKTSNGTTICTFRKEENQTDSKWDTWTICEQSET